MEIGDMRERIRSLNVGSLIDESINETKEQLIELVRSQILHGERRDGTAIGEYSKSSYDFGYIDDKWDLGLFPIDTEPNYNLNWTGRFLSSIKLVIQSEFVEIGASPTTEGYVEKNVDNLDDVYVLTPERLENYVNNYFYPVFIRKFREKLEL